MKLISWNVNGIRAAVKKDFYGFVADQAADYVCVQETKARPDDLLLALPDYHASWDWAEKKGYSGTLILSRVEPQEVSRGIGIAAHDTEGRVVTAEMDDHYVICVYTPNAKRDLTRLPYRQEWDAAFRAYCAERARHKPVILCGDFNVAHTEDDLANPKANKKKHGFTQEERDGFQALLDAGFVDTFRQFHSGNGHYSWWAQWGGARERNVGWRLDYVLASESLRERLQSAEILADVMGSDHCPVSLTFTTT